MPPSPSVAAPVMVAPIPAATGTVRVKGGDDDPAAHIDDQGYAVHAFAIGCGNNLSQPGELPPADHQRSAPIAYKRAPISIGIDGLQDPHRNAARLCPLASVVRHDQRTIVNMHLATLDGGQSAASTTGTAGAPDLLQGARRFFLLSPEPQIRASS
jgi:hypothetical protein